MTAQASGFGSGERSSVLPSISVIICALNEERCLPKVLPRIPHYVDEVILVDGHSTDRTVEVAKELRPDIKVISQEGKGRGNALLCGMKVALGEYCLFLDADGSQKPEELNALLHWGRQGYDIVKGSRYLPGGRSQDETILRRLCVWFACKTANLLLGTQLTDAAYGLCLAKRDTLARLHLSAQSFDFEWELAARAVREGIHIKEIPAQEDARVDGKSKLLVARDGWVIARRVLIEFVRKLGWTDDHHR